jgi:VIT1/CCC1 family predicted Fe2+/Mn2+ transporter
MAIKGIQGATFGIMDGVITVLGVLVGLGAMGSRTGAIIGVLAAGIADAMANAAGFHVSQETEDHHSRHEVFMSTTLCFLATLLTMFLFLLPLFLLTLRAAIYVSVLLGIAMLIGLGTFVSSYRKINKRDLIIEYVVVGLFVVAASYAAGTFVASII